MYLLVHLILKYWLLLGAVLVELIWRVAAVLEELFIILLLVRLEIFLL